MKKSFVIFVGMLFCCLAVMCVLPGIILKEADHVIITEQVLFGDKALIEGVSVQSSYHSMEHLFWTTEYVAGKEPVTETEFEFSASRRGDGESELLEQSRITQSEHDCLMLVNRMHSGWSSSSNGGLDLEKDSIVSRGLSEAYKELAKEVNSGEEKEKVIFLSEYMEYYPISVSLDTVWEEDGLSEGYSEFFKIPVPESAMYKISLEKNEDGDIISAGGREHGQGSFDWNSVSTRSETDCYFTFERFLADGTMADTGQISGGYGIYRQPYTLEAGEIIMDASELSMVYSLEEEIYPYGNMFLDVNAAGQLLIVTDTENATRLQVVDTENMECVQQLEIPRPGESKGFDNAVWTEDEFILLSYSGGYFMLIDWNMVRGYEHQFTVQVAEDDLLYWSRFAEYKDMDWNGKQLLYAACMERETMEQSCDFIMAVYDATGKIYEGNYYCSLLTGQDREYPYTLEEECCPWWEQPITVSWPE